jgi:protein-S-isoprenylcysteine O-methyltransferase Ste14
MDSNTLKIGLGAILMAAFWLLLPLAGWGPGDIEGFLSHPARAYVLLVSAVTMAYTMIVMKKQGLKMMDKGVKENITHRLTIYLFSILGVFISVLPPYFERNGIMLLDGGDPVRYAGLVVFTAGIIFMSWGPLHLGKQFSIYVTLQDDHRLVTDGPYSIMRHPRYSGIVLWTFGLALIFLSLPGLVIGAATLVVVLWRIRDEEQLLHGEFGTEWEHYARHTKKLLPYLY